MTHYEVIGIERSAPHAEVRRAFVAAARQNHPDLAGGSEEAMRRVNEAWAVLGDPVRRRAYDEELAAEARTAWEPGTSHPNFVPIDGDDGADVPMPVDDAEPVARWQQLLPAVLMVIASVSVMVGLVVSLRPLVAFGAMAFVGAGVSFVLVPMIEVLRTHDRYR